MGVLLAVLAVSLVGWLRAGDFSAERTVYERHCQICHASDGSGKKEGRVLPVFRMLKLENEKQLSLLHPEARKATDAEVEKAIAEGKGKMKGMKEKMTPEEIRGQVAYTRHLQSKAP